MKTDAQIMREFDQFIFLSKFGMIVLGIWPVEKKVSLLMIFVRKMQLSIVYFSITLMLCAQWLDMYSLWGNVEANSETFISNAFSFAVMMKFYSFVKYADTFRDILQTMRMNWLRVMTEAEAHNKDLMHSVMMKARSRSNKYFLMIGTAASLYCLMPFLRDNQFRERMYPYFGRYYFDQDSDIVYVVCYLSQVLTGSLIGLANCVTDTIFLVCTYHFSVQLQILQNDFVDLGYNDHRDSRLVISLIKRHQAEIRSAEALQSMFSQSSLQQILFSCLMICMNGFRLIVSFNRQDADVVLYFVVLTVILLQILFYCHPGNELIIQSQLLNEAMYKSSWLDLDKTSIKNLIFMIQRSQKPLAIIAGKIYILSLENFMRVLKTSMSGLSVLQAVHRRNI